MAFFKNKYQEKAWKNSFTAENKAAARKLKKDLRELGPHGVARRDKTEHLAREAKDDARAISEGEAKFRQAVELKHSIFGSYPGWEHLKSDWPKNQQSA